MERSGSGVEQTFELGDLASIFDREGPFLTVWAARLSVMAAAEHPLVAKLPDVAGSLLPESAVDALADVMRAAFPEATGFIGVAAPSGVLVAEHLDHAPRRELARLQTLPSLTALIEHRQSSVACVIVLADRHGADLSWSGSADGRPGSRHVDAADGPTTKVAAGGWSQRRFQQRAENTWEHTAADIAAALTEIVAKVGPRLIAVAGDVRTIQFLRDKVPAQTSELFRDVPGSRSDDGAGEDRTAAVRRWIRTTIAEDTVAALQLFEQERGLNDRAADGVSATMEALREGRVETLLVHDDPDDDRVAWFAPENPMLVSDSFPWLVDFGYPAPREGRLIDVAIRAALASSAGVRIVPAAGPVNERIGAILRW